MLPLRALFLNAHFKDLYKERLQELDMDYLALLDIPQVTERDNYILEAEILLEEIHLALKSMNTKKCPGSDGLPVEFYLKFWPVLASTITKLFNTIVQRKILNRSAREAITSLMGKPKRDPLHIKNWRPLSLLNTDYKLYAKVIARRLEPIAKYTISDDQKGFLKKRNISDNLLNLLSVVDYCNSNQYDSILISVDFHSAFDSCSWAALVEVFRAYGFSSKFIDMIMICYTDIKTAVMNNNTWSD